MWANSKTGSEFPEMCWLLTVESTPIERIRVRKEDFIDSESRSSGAAHSGRARARGKSTEAAGAGAVDQHGYACDAVKADHVDQVDDIGYGYDGAGLNSERPSHRRVPCVAIPDAAILVLQTGLVTLVKQPMFVKALPAPPGGPVSGSVDCHRWQTY